MSEALLVLNGIAAAGSGALAIIVERSGSVPRGVGAMLFLHQDGGCIGTVGGGRIEREVINALQSLSADTGGCLRQFRLLPEHDGMSCGGALTVLMAPLTQLEKPYFESLRYALQEGMAGFLRVCVDTKGRVVWLESGQAAPDGQLFELTFSPEPELFVFGAGHIARALAQMAQMAGFAVKVFDDRPEYLAAHPFEEGIESFCLDNFWHLPGELVIGANSFLVIATYGHQQDQVVLGRALATDAIYIGMVGSRRKREEIFSSLRSAGFSDESLSRVRCPVGVTIGAETPAEIAVSILAEMIAVRRGGK